MSQQSENDANEITCLEFLIEIDSGNLKSFTIDFGNISSSTISNYTNKHQKPSKNFLEKVHKMY